MLEKIIVKLVCLLILFSTTVLKVGAQTSEPVPIAKNRLTIAAGASGQWMRVPHGYNSDRAGIIQKQRNAVGWNVPIMIGFGLNNPRTQFMVGIEFGQIWASSEHVVPNQFGLGTQTEIEKLRDGTFGFVFGPKLTFGKMSVGLYGHIGTFSTRLRRYIGTNDNTPEMQMEDFMRLYTRYCGASFDLAHQIAEWSNGRLDTYVNTGFSLSSFERIPFRSSTTSLTSRIGIIYTMQIR